MSFRNVPIARKLAIGFGSVLTIVAASSLFIFVEINQLAEISRLSDVSDNAVDLIDQVWGDLNAVRADLERFIATGTPSDKVAEGEALAEMRRDIAAAEAILAKDGAEITPLADSYDTAVGGYVTRFINVETDLASDPAKRQRAVDMVASSEEKAQRAVIDQAFASLREKTRQWSDGLTGAGATAMGRIELAVTLAAGLSILLGAAMAWLMAGSVARPLSAIASAMRRLAAGEAGVEVPSTDRTDEIGEMAGALQVFKDKQVKAAALETEAAAARESAKSVRMRGEEERTAGAKEQAHVVGSLAQGLESLAGGALGFRIAKPFAADYDKLRVDFNGAMEKLQDTMKIVAANTSAIRSGSGEISTAADDLSRRTEQQAASLEETAAALDEITATVRKTADGSKHARTVVGQAKQAAERSGEIVRQAVEAMGGIEASSGQIGNIIGVIDEIAFQTNLLALNAGVEAARAGEAGRGFAVVASEVRALAQRSAEAAKEIKALIAASSSHVERGVGLVGQTGQALEKIVAHVAEINAIVGEIAASAQEQASGLDQVNTAVNQMDQVTQQNAAMVEETTAASHALVRETDELSRVVAGFEVGGEAQAPARRSAREPARAAPNPQRTASAMKTIGRGAAAARKPAPAAEDQSWQEF